MMRKQNEFLPWVTFSECYLKFPLVYKVMVLIRTCSLFVYLSSTMAKCAIQRSLDGHPLEKSEYKA